MVKGLAPSTLAVVHSHDTICRRLRIQYVFLHMCGVKPVLDYCLRSCKTSNNILFCIELIQRPESSLRRHTLGLTDQSIHNSLTPTAGQWAREATTSQGAWEAMADPPLGCRSGSTDTWGRSGSAGTTQRFEGLALGALVRSGLWGALARSGLWGALARAGSGVRWRVAGSGVRWRGAGSGVRWRGAGSGVRWRGAGTGLEGAVTGRLATWTAGGLVIGTAGGLAILTAGGLAILTAGGLALAANGGRLAWATDGSVNFPANGGLERAADGGMLESAAADRLDWGWADRLDGGLALAANGGGWGRAADDGWAGSGLDTRQTPENTFPPTQSGAVWEVHGMVGVGPEPEQLIKCCVIPRGHRSELAELPGELIGCIRKLRQLTCCLMRQWVCRQRFLHEGTSRNWFRTGFWGRVTVLMIYNKTERVLVITKLIFNYYNTDFSLEITSKVQKVSQKYTFKQTDHQTQLSDAIFIF